MITIETEVFNYETEEGKVKEVIFNYDTEVDVMSIDIGKRGVSFTWEEWKDIVRSIEDERDDYLSPFNEAYDNFECKNDCEKWDVNE